MRVGSSFQSFVNTFLERVRGQGVLFRSQPASTRREGTSSIPEKVVNHSLTEAVDTAETPAMFADGGLCAAAAFSRQ